jgi:hypothetical protein
MKYSFLFVVLILPFIATAQITVSSVSPVNGATNVPLSTTLSITFSEAFDSTKGMGYTNITQSSNQIISPDRRTITNSITLSANTAYFFIFINVVAEGGSRLAPFVTYFTTGSSFPSTSISGVVQSGSTGVPPENSIVFVSNKNPMETEDSPDFVMATFAEASGNFTIPYVVNGQYYLTAVKDVDGVEGIDTDISDVISNVDSLTMNNTNITGITLTFKAKKSFSEARGLAASNSVGLPAANNLRRVEGNRVDSTGRAGDWDFYYVASTPTDGHFVNVDIFRSKVKSVDTSFARWLLQADVFNPNLAADASVFIANVENAGGRVFRQTTPSGGYFNCSVKLGDLMWSEYGSIISDPTKLYWGAFYVKDWWIGEQVYSDTKLFLGDFTTGEVLLAVDVKDAKQNQPNTFVLDQNYPNPFNPATAISYKLSAVSSVSLKVYDVLGREVAELVNKQQPAGNYKVDFDGNKLPSGLYIYRLQAGQFSETKKMLLIK